MSTDQEVLDRALGSLGYTPDDESVEAQRAQTWVAATFDEEMCWLEAATPEQLRDAYSAYRRSVYGS
jgi:hypothetical protein